MPSVDYVDVGVFACTKTIHQKLNLQNIRCCGQLFKKTSLKYQTMSGNGIRLD